ncbi:MAG: hypothetical protein ACI8TP_001580 [Acidimicrobiales bacterium]
MRSEISTSPDPVTTAALLASEDRERGEWRGCQSYRRTNVDVTNEVMPTSGERVEEMKQPGPDGPISMVNLLKFKEHAEYEDGRETDLSGREAYQIYGREVSKLIRQYGGKVTFVGDVTFLALGQVEDLWDEVAIAQYPSRVELWEMSTSPEWLEISVHRAAGLAGQLNIETVLSTFEQ